MSSSKVSASRRDNLRFMAARDATQLAISKWQRVAFGIDRATDPEVVELAKDICIAIEDALWKFNERV